MSKPDVDYPKNSAIDNILVDFADKHNKGFYGNGTPEDALRIKQEARQALYTRLATEADLTWKKDNGTDEQYVSLSKLKELFNVGGDDDL